MWQDASVRVDPGERSTVYFQAPCAEQRSQRHAGPYNEIASFGANWPMQQPEREDSTNP